jgi:hypothetical protein
MIRATIGCFSLGWVTHNVARMIYSNDTYMVNNIGMFIFAVLLLYVVIGYFLVYKGVKANRKVLNNKEGK